MIDEYYHKIFTEDCDDFENIRKEILKEENWLKENYTEKSFKVSDHVGVSAVFHKSGNLWAIGGLYEYDQNVARAFNRSYLFPNYRTKSISEFINMCKIGEKHILEPLDKIKKYPSTIITMQDRRASRKWFKFCAQSINKTFQDTWNYDGKHIKTCKSEDDVCYQNFIWRGEYPLRKVRCPA